MQQEQRRATSNSYSTIHYTRSSVRPENPVGEEGGKAVSHKSPVSEKLAINCVLLLGFCVLETGVEMEVMVFCDLSGCISVFMEDS